jgi:rare lipoprotein A
MKLPIFILALAVSAIAVQAKEPGGTKQTGLASWYGKECSKTASGERYDPSSMTAAHRTLPFGTLVQVKNLSTGCNATVRINDRGPYCRGRIIDVSKTAAQRLKMIQSGTATVQLLVLR